MMEKIRLKPWQKILIFSVAALLILLVIINIILNQKPSESNSLVSVKMNIDLEPTDSTFRVFNEEKTLGDTARFEIISGGDQGWVFQIFAKGKAINYILYIDFRQTEHKWKKGDSLVFVQNIRGIKPNCPLGLFQPKLESKLKINNNSFLYDNLIFSKYYFLIKCEQFDSLASFTGGFYAEQYLLNPEVYEDKLILTGAFRADSLKIGNRIVN